MMRVLRQWGPGLAFFLVAALAALALHVSEVNTSHKLYENSYHACLRGNSKTLQLNRTVGDLRAADTINVNFYRDASHARKLNYKAYHLPADREAAIQYQTLATNLAAKRNSLKSFPIFNCDQVIHKP